MSAIRSGNKRASRGFSPYGRPPPKKSSWSISSLFSYLNPLRSSSSNEDMDVASQSGSEPEETPEPEPESSQQQPSAAQTLANVGHRMTRDLAGPSTFDPPPQREALFSPPRKGASLPFPITTSRVQDPGRYTSIDLLSQPVETLNLSPQEKHTYAQALRDRANQLEPAAAEPANRGRAEFRFSHSPAPHSAASSPARAPSPTKMLARNPNGAYRWSGGGSSKRPRRSETPGSGIPRASSERAVAKSAQSSTTDNKRRRVGVAGAGSTITRDRSPPRQLSRSRSPAPDPSPTRVAHAPPLATPGRISPSRTMPSFGTPTKSKPNLSVSASTSRLQVPRYSSPATPVVPSPLRQSQTWGQGSPGSTGSRSPDSTPPQKQTKAATIMAGLIKEASSSSKVADVANPYQKNNVITRPKRARLSGRTPAPKQVEEKKPEPALTPSAIIDMTLPKGSKRSRPSRGGITNGSGSLTIELPTVDEDEHVNKRTKPSPPSSTIAEPSTSGPPSLFPSPAVTPAATTSASSAPSSSTFGLGRPSTSHIPRPIPREPSKLRHSTKFDSASSDGASSADNSSEPPRSAASAPTFEMPDSAMDVAPAAMSVAPASSLPSSAFTFAPPPTSTATVAATNGVESAMTGVVNSTALQRTDTVLIPDEDAIKARVLKTSTNLLPRVDFSRSEVVQPDVSKEVMDRVLKAGKAGITSVDFSKPAPGLPATATVAAISSAPAAKPFDFAAAGFKPKAAAGWTCGSCKLTNTNASLVKCGICDTPREEASTNGTVAVKEKEKPVAPPPAAPVKPFDWAAAGMVKKAASADEWTCGMCGLKSTGKTKCTVCEADRP